MLVNSKLPTTFWAEAVNTTCYMLNRALVIKPHNKTPYELIRGRPPLIDIMKPFGCPVTILNTMDNLVKFDEKADEGFFVGYFMVSKALRVLNKRTRIVEETLNIRFLKNAPNVKGNRPDWIFDINSLTISMNYVPVVAGFQTNGIVGTKDNIVAGQSEKKKEPEQEYILIPICTTDPLISQGPKDNAVDAGKKATKVDESQVLDNGGQDDEVTKTVEEEVDMNNVVSSYINPDAPLTKFLKDHPKDQTLVDLPKDKWAIGTKWVFRNKKDERGIVIKNKAILVTQGHTQEEGIDYDEVFAPIARIEAIRLFLAYASFKDYVVYQMDVKSAFVYRKIEDEVYVCQAPGFEDPNFPDKVYKVEKALFGLHQDPRACQDKYMADIQKKFDFSIIKTPSTLMEPKKALVKDAEAEDVDMHLYRSVIRSLMYLTASRPDITFAVCACARFQVTPKTLHLHVVKRIFRYLKGQPKLGLWYPKDLPFDLEAYSDSDYARASLDKKSTTGIYASCVKQFWITTKVKKVNGQEQIQALVDKQKVIIMEESIRRDLKFNDVEITSCLPNDTIFQELARMGAKTTAWNEFSITMASAIICLANNQKFIFSKYIFDHIVKHLEGGVKFLMFPRFLEIPVEESILTPSNNLLPSGEDSIQLNELMIFYTNLQQRVLDLEEANIAQAKKIAKLKKRVKKLKNRRTSRPAGLRRLKKGRSIEDIDQDAEIALVDEAQGRMHDADMFRLDSLESNEVFLDVGEKIIEKEVSTADPVTTAGEVVTAASVEDSDAPTTATTAGVDDELIAIKAAKPKVISTAITTPRAKGIVFYEQVQAHKPTVSSSKDKGKAKMTEPEKPSKKKDQIALDEEVAIKLEAAMGAKMEEKERIAREKDEANRAVIEEWDDVQATIDADM
nr:hypothetical protein [Tanacetum cinerariifolium]